MKPLSIKIKVTLVATGAFLALLALVSAIQMVRSQADIGKVVGDQQFTLVSHVAEEIDDRLASRHQALIAVANRIPAGIVHNAAEVERNLVNRPGLQAVFDSLFFISMQGEVTVDLPAAARRGIMVADREYFRHTIASRQPYISQPFHARKKLQPVIMFTAPVLDERGDVVGILGASLDLFGRNFLGKLSSAEVGKTGTFALFGRDRTIVMSHHRERVMTKGPAPGENAYFDRATSGQSGWEEATDNHGLHAVFSYKPLVNAPWVLVAALPVAEAYAPVALAQKGIACAALILALLIAPLIWLGIRRVLAPLLLLHDAIHEMRENPDAVTEVPIRRQDEIGDVADDFNALMRERRTAQAALQKSEGRLRAMFEQTAVGVAILDARGVYVDVNEKLCEMLHYRREDMIGMHFDRVIHPADLPATLAHREKRARGEITNYSLDKRYLTSDGRSVWVNATAATISGTDGRDGHLISIIKDVSERKQAQQLLEASRAQLEQMAHHDALTGLPNRALFNDRLAQALTRSARNRQPMALMYLDIDRFKSINDTLGHAAGDELLKGFAQRLLRCARASDTVARLGGDEFVIVLENLHRTDECCRIAQKIIDSMQQPFDLGTRAERIGTSIGIAFTEAAAVDAEELLKRADEALYEAKAGGRNRFRVARPHLTEVSSTDALEAKRSASALA